MDLGFSQTFFEKYSNVKFKKKKFRQLVAGFFDEERRMDGRTGGETKMSLSAVLQKHLKAILPFISVMSVSVIYLQLQKYRNFGKTIRLFSCYLKFGG